MEAVVVDDQLAVDVQARAVVGFREEAIRAVLGNQDDPGESETELFLAAAGGTLVLEAIDALEPSARTALTGALKVGTFRQEGGDRDHELTARVIVTAPERRYEGLFGGAARTIALAPLGGEAYVSFCFV